MLKQFNWFGFWLGGGGSHRPPSKVYLLPWKQHLTKPAAIYTKTDLIQFGRIRLNNSLWKNGLIMVHKQLYLQTTLHGQSRLQPLSMGGVE